MTHYPYPVFLKLAARCCIVIGGGNVAVRKVGDLIEAGAEVTVVAESPHQQIVKLAEEGVLKLIRRRFDPGDVKQAFLVFAATDDKAVNAEIGDYARRAGALVNEVDNPDRCDFFSGAVMKNGALRIAVSTSGLFPGMAACIRRELEDRYGGDLSGFLETAGEMRQYIISLADTPEKTKNRALEWLCERDTLTLFQQSGKDHVWKQLKKIISS